jgi:hypothetical protein
VKRDFFFELGIQVNELLQFCWRHLRPEHEHGCSQVIVVPLSFVLILEFGHFLGGGSGGFLPFIKIFDLISTMIEKFSEKNKKREEEEEEEEEYK